MNRLKIFNRKKSDNKEVSVIDPADIKKGDPINTNGPLGDVYRCLSRKSKSAVKYFNKADSSFSTTFLKETESLKKIFHPNIILMMGVVVNKPQAIVMEVMKCNLYHVIYEPTKCPKTLQNMTDLNKFKILRDVSVGLTFIHNFAKIPHGNLKLTNILFDENGKVKLSDFGLSVYTSPVKKNNLPFYTCSNGTNLYQAPEVWSGAELSCASDVYSFGLIILEFLTGNNGFYGDCNTNDDQSIFLAITNSQRPKIPSDFSPSLSSVLQKCLSPSPHGRPSMEVVLGSFDSVVVDSTMTSPSAIAFWTSQCVDIDLPMFEVSYDDLLYFITEVAMLEVNEEEVEVVKDALKVYFPENGIVSAVDFDNVALWFGDFFNSYKILEEMTEIKEADWFTGLIDKKIAEGRLSGKPDGVFLIRMSFTNAQKTPFTLTRNVNGMVKHSRIERVSYDFVNIRYKINIDGKKISGPDLPSIINALIENNIVTTADDGETVSAYGDL